MDLGWLFTIGVQSPIGLTVASVGEGENWVSYLTAHGLYPFLIPKSSGRGNSANPSLMGPCLSLLQWHFLSFSCTSVLFWASGMRFAWRWWTVSPLPTQSDHGPGWKPCYISAQLSPAFFICFLHLGAATGSWTLSPCSLFAFDHMETLLLTPPGPGFALLGLSSSFSAISAHAGIFQPLQNTQSTVLASTSLANCWWNNSFVLWFVLTVLLITKIIVV